MNTEEVNLGHSFGFVMNSHMHRNRSYAAHESVGLHVANTHMPVADEARRRQSPLQEGDGVVEPAVMHYRMEKMLVVGC